MNQSLAACVCVLALSAPVSCKAATAGPVISSFSPTDGAPGASVKLSGSGFSGVTSVTFSGVQASFTVASPSQIAATVPAHAANGKLAVVSANGTAHSRAAFWVDNFVDTGFAVTPLKSAAYTLQADEWNSSAPLKVASDGGVDLRIIDSAIGNATNGAPGAYPSLYRGCHWGSCTSGSGLPVAVAALQQPGTVTTTIRSTTVSGGAWNDAYDIWFNASTSTGDNQTGLELMVWMAHSGAVQPVGATVQDSVIGGRDYIVWYGGAGHNGGTVSLVLKNPSTAMVDLDLGPLAAFAVARGYMANSWYLIDVEAGFEVWQGGTGLTVKSFKVCDPAGC